MYPLPSLEAERIREIHATGLIGCEAGPELDAVVELTARTLGFPICLLSLVDSERLWIPARRGLAVNETGRDIAFCSHTIASDLTLVVEDTTRDNRFAANPLVTGAPFARFYAGVPLLVRPTGFTD